MPRIPEKLRQDRREAIVQAAVDSLALHGYQGTSMRTIAEAVGLTKGGLYPYFPNKDAILLAVSDRYLEHVVARLQPREGVEPARQLAEYLDDFEAAFHDARTVSARRGVLDLWLAAGDSPAVRRSIEKRFAAVGEGLAAIVRRAQDEGTFRRDVDPELVAGLVLAARDGMLFQKVKLRAPVPVRELTELLKRLLLDALAVPPDRAAAPASAPRRAARPAHATATPGLTSSDGAMGDQRTKASRTPPSTGSMAPVVREERSEAR